MRVDFHRSFLKEYRKLPKKIKLQFIERKDLFLSDPFHLLLNNHPVEKSYPGCRSVSVTGDYRAIFAEKDDGVLFVHIGTHSELYG